MTSSDPRRPLGKILMHGGDGDISPRHNVTQTGCALHLHLLFPLEELMFLSTAVESFQANQFELVSQKNSCIILNQASLG